MGDSRNKTFPVSDPRNHAINSLEASKVAPKMAKTWSGAPYCPGGRAGWFRGGNENFALATGEGGVGS